jgi:hypothetical protein
MSPPSITLGLNSSSLDSLHLLSLRPRAMCKGFCNGLNKLATRLVCLGKSDHRVV